MINVKLQVFRRTSSKDDICLPNVHESWINPSAPGVYGFYCRFMSVEQLKAKIEKDIVPLLKKEKLKCTDFFEPKSIETLKTLYCPDLQDPDDKGSSNIMKQTNKDEFNCSSYQEVTVSLKGCIEDPDSEL